MSLTERIDLLAELGEYLRSPALPDELEAIIRQSKVENQWFTEENTRAALRAIAENFLQKDALTAWASRYPIADDPHPTRTIGLVMAGNIPLVGFHDWLCVFVAGHQAKVKLSDKDKRLLPFLVKKMGEWAFESWSRTEFLDDAQKLNGFDAVIATGSNNSARYFEQYFGKYPHLIRRNRNSVAVLDGIETMADLYALGADILSYFGLGCRNVSKLYVPRGYDFQNLLEATHEYRDIVLHDKYKNNFDYNFTLFILNRMPHLNNGCLLLREDPSLTARIASLHYEFYDSKEQLAADLTARRDEIQCLVAHAPVPGFEVVSFGKSQSPGLMDYPDGVDVMAFLSK